MRATTLACKTMDWSLPFEADRWKHRTRTTGSRLQGHWAAYIRRIPWQWFVTLTFMRERLSADVASREGFWWLGLVGHLSSQPIVWIHAVERQSDGRHHVHALITDFETPDWRAAKQV